MNSARYYTTHTMQPLDFIRYAKRQLLTGGFAKPTYRFLEKLTQPEKSGTIPVHNRYLVNLSFDFELALSTYFWEQDFENALRVGRKAQENVHRTLQILNAESLEYNVQVVGMLLDTEILSSPLFTDAHRDFIARHRELFRLSPDHLEHLAHPTVDVGIHGYSHRLFTTLTETEAREEIKMTTDLFESELHNHLPSPTFMAFPRNYAAHTHILPEYGIHSWRSATPYPYHDGRIPRGLWFAPGIINPTDLTRVLHRIQSTKKGFLLHFWNHFTEMDIETLCESISILKKSGWEFIHIKHFRQEYG